MSKIFSLKIDRRKKTKFFAIYKASKRVYRDKTLSRIAIWVIGQREHED